MSKPIITFFTIAYNDEHYIRTTIESVLSQTERNIEYYIRDNGSTDSTYQIIQEYALRDHRIKVFHNDVNGVFEIVEPHHFTRPDSEYLTMLDSDDFVHPDYVKKLVASAQANSADIVVAGTKMFKDGSSMEIVTENKPLDRIFHVGEILSVDCIRSAYGQLRPLWGKIFRTEFFYEKFATWFHKYPGKTLHAIDTVVSLSLINQANTVVFTSECLHFYRIKGQSKFTNHTPDYTRIFDLIEIYELGLELLQKMRADSAEGIQLIQSIARGHIKDLMDMMLSSMDSEIDHKRKFIQQVFMQPRIFEIKRIIGYQGLMNQIEPLLNFIKQWNCKNGVNSNELADILCFSKLKPSSIIVEKLLMSYLGFSKEVDCSFFRDDLYYWNDALRIPKWYVLFCSLDEEQKIKLMENKNDMIQLIESTEKVEDIELLKNQILDWIDQGMIKESQELIEQLFISQPLDFHLLYLRLYVSALEMNIQVLNETWLLLNAYYSHETELLMELEKIYRSSICNH